MHPSPFTEEQRRAAAAVVSRMRYDNERGRFAQGFDCGTIVDGTVTRDPETGRLVLVDEDGVAFDPHVALESLDGKHVRLTVVSFDAMQAMEKLLNRAQS